MDEWIRVADAEEAKMQTAHSCVTQQKYIHKEKTRHKKHATAIKTS